MRCLDDGEILALAQNQAAHGPSGQALRLLEAAYPDTDSAAIHGASLSARDRALLQLRAALFGSLIRCREICASCGEILETDFTAGDIGLEPIDPPFPPAPQGVLTNYATVHAITAADAAAAEAARDPIAARRRLAERVAPDAPDAPDLEVALEALDAAADVRITLRCPACGTTTLRLFDAAAFLCREIEARVPLILRDVVDLAREFHWSEQDILSLPQARRAFYLAEARA